MNNATFQKNHHSKEEKNHKKKKNPVFFGHDITTYNHDITITTHIQHCFQLQVKPDTAAYLNLRQSITTYGRERHQWANGSTHGLEAIPTGVSTPAREWANRSEQTHRSEQTCTWLLDCWGECRADPPGSQPRACRRSRQCREDSRSSRAPEENM